MAAGLRARKANEWLGHDHLVVAGEVGKHVVGQGVADAPLLAVEAGEVPNKANGKIPLVEKVMAHTRQRIQRKSRHHCPRHRLLPTHAGKSQHPQHQSHGRRDPHGRGGVPGLLRAAEVLEHGCSQLAIKPVGILPLVRRCGKGMLCGQCEAEVFGQQCVRLVNVDVVSFKCSGAIGAASQVQPLWPARMLGDKVLQVVHLAIDEPHVRRTTCQCLVSSCFLHVPLTRSHHQGALQAGVRSHASQLLARRQLHCAREKLPCALSGNQSIAWLASPPTLFSTPRSLPNSIKSWMLPAEFATQPAWPPEQKQIAGLFAHTRHASTSLWKG
eukprot:m.212354 g.212354  ORF g.212354 m.212354 type:complete len:328 (-) comp22149_c0_seq5:1628-2611(-)